MESNRKKNGKSVSGDREAITTEAVITEVFCRLNHTKKPYCILRGLEHFPHLREGSDIDLIVMPKEMNKMRDIIEQVCEEMGALAIRRFELGYLHGVGAVFEEFGLHFDLLPGLMYLGIEIIRAQGILTRRQLRDAVFFADEPDRIWFTALQKILFGRVLPKPITSELADFLSRNQDLPEVVNDLPPFVNRSIENIMKDSKNIRVHRWLILLCSLLEEKKRKGKWPDVLYAAWLLARLRWKHNGLFFVFIGLDIFDKSDIASRVAKPFIEVQHIKKAHFLHLRPKLLPALDALARMLTMRKSLPVSEKTENPQCTEPSGKIESVLKLIYYFIDYTGGYLLKMKPLLIRNQIILSDGYYYDFIIDPERMRINLPKWLIKALLSFVPKPNATIFVKADEVEWLPRKCEISLAQYEQHKSEIYKLSRDNAEFIIIDANKSEDMVVVTVIRKLAEIIDSKKMGVDQK